VKYLQVFDIDQRRIIIRSDGRWIKKCKPVVPGKKDFSVRASAPGFFVILIPQRSIRLKEIGDQRVFTGKFQSGNTVGGTHPDIPGNLIFLNTEHIVAW